MRLPVVVEENRELLWSLLSRELRGQYKRSTLGWLWSLLNPLSLVLTYWLVFRIVFRAEPPIGEPSGLHSYVLFLLVGLVPWTLFSQGVAGGSASLVEQSSLITKVYFPRITVVLAKLMAQAVMSSIEFAVLLVILILAGNFTLPWLPVFALLFVLQLVLVTGVALMVSVGNVYFRDVQYLLGIGLQLLFYVSPVIYAPSFVKPRVSEELFFLYNLNPIARLTTMYRDVLYHLRFPALFDVVYLACVSAIVLAIGLRVFHRFEPRLAEEL